MEVDWSQLQLDNEELSINYTESNDEVYKSKKDHYIDLTNYPTELLGKENTPEFYACLPLIKI